MVVIKLYDCCICSKRCEGWGNNAQPIMEGKCCDDCNINKVIPTRLGNIIEGEKLK